MADLIFSRGGRLLAAMLVVVALLVASRARASVRDGDDVSSCATETERSAGDVIVPTTVFSGGPVGITIVEGETLSLVAQVEDNGSLTKLRLADRVQNEPALILVRMDPPGPLRELHVRTSSGRWLLFDVAYVDGAGTARPLAHLRVPPDGRYFPAPDAIVHELLLDELQLYDPPTPSRAPRRTAVESRAQAR